MDSKAVKVTAAAAVATAIASYAGSKMLDEYIVNRPMASIETAVEYFRAGKPVIVMDDENRENEGDIVIPAQNITEEVVALMVNYTTGILCTPMTEDRANELGLYPMLSVNTDPKGTAFTVTTDLKAVVPANSALIPDLADEEGYTGITTGVSAWDRMRTFHALAHPKARASDFSRPGHIFPLRAKRAGVRERRGHTEASVDLCRIAGLRPVAVIGELVNLDGSMKRLPDCKRFGWKYGIPICTIDALANYLYKRPLSILMPTCDVARAAQCTIPITKQGKFLGEWEMLCYKEAGRFDHVVMVYGDLSKADTVLLRIHSECFTGDLLGSMRCDCGEQLDETFLRIHKHGCGIVIYMVGHEGRGIGLINKMHAYMLQQSKGIDTYKANRELGFADDLRNFDACVEIVKDLGVINRTIKLLTNSPLKQRALQALKGKIRLEVEPLLCEHNQFNSRYLTDKRNHEIRLREGGIGTGPDTMRFSLHISDREHTALTGEIRVVIIRTMWFGVPLRNLQKQIVSVLRDQGVSEANISEVVVPGAAHLPYAAKICAQHSHVDAILCLGITVRGGEVPHAFACMSSAVTNGLTMTQLLHGVPVLFGVLACEHKQQAIDRCSEGSEHAYNLALSTIQVGTERRRACMFANQKLNLGPLASFQDEAALLSPTGMRTMSQESAANAKQAGELETHIVLPPPEVAKTLRVTLVVTAWNQSVVDRMASQVKSTLIEKGITEGNIATIRVPGSFEIPYAASLAARTSDVVVTVGLLIKGDTAHFEYIALSEALGTIDVQLYDGVPVVSGVVLCANEQQIDSKAKETPTLLALSALHQAFLNSSLRESPTRPTMLSFPATSQPPSDHLAGADTKRIKDIPRCLVVPDSGLVKNLRVGIVRTSWSEEMVLQLTDGVKGVMKKAGLSADQIVETVVPGSYELPVAAQLMAETGEFDAVLCIGVLIKGDTKHFDYICQSTSHGVLRAQQLTKCPMLFGVLTCFTVEQARERAGPGSELHYSLATSTLHMACLSRASGRTPKAPKKREPFPTRHIPPEDCRSALDGELIKDIPRFLNAPVAEKAKNLRVAVVATADEEVELVQDMVDGVMKVVKQAAIPTENVAVHWVPAAFDLPHGAHQIIQDADVDAVLAIGVLIDGNPTFTAACEACSYGLQEVALRHKVPVLFGTLTCNTREQARIRAQAGSELHYSLTMSMLHMGCLAHEYAPRQPRSGKLHRYLKSSLVVPSVERAQQMKVALVRTSWCENLVLAKVEALRSELLDKGVKLHNIVEEVVPGTYEMPYTALQLAKEGKYDAVCLLGVMIQGDVANFEYMAAATARGYAVIGAEQVTPIVWGISCVYSIDDLLDESTGDETARLGRRLMSNAILSRQIRGEL